MYLKLISSEFYKSDGEQLISLPYLACIYCNSILSISGDEPIIMGILMKGDCILVGNNVDIFANADHQPSNKIFMKPIYVAANGLVKYNNDDDGDSFQYRLGKIEHITSWN